MVVLQIKSGHLPTTPIEACPEIHREIERGLKIPDEPAVFGVSDTQERPIVEAERSRIQALSLEVIFFFPIGL